MKIPKTIPNSFAVALDVKVGRSVGTLKAVAENVLSKGLVDWDVTTHKPISCDVEVVVPSRKSAQLGFEVCAGSFEAVVGFGGLGVGVLDEFDESAVGVEVEMAEVLEAEFSRDIVKSML